jgi:hypothetical protein
MTDWATVATMSTAAGTFALAVATFSSTRSANRSARIAERAYQARLRPLLVPSRLEDPAEKIMWGDQHWSLVPGGRGSVEIGDDAVYLAMSLRNVGNGMAVIHGWHAMPDNPVIGLTSHPDPDREFRLQTRDLYVPPGDTSFWQGAFRERDERDVQARTDMADAILRRQMITVFLLYGDHEGGQRTISRFSLVARSGADDPNVWIVSVNRHWNLDRDDPR